MKIFYYLSFLIFVSLTEATYNPFKGSTLNSVSRQIGQDPIQIDIDLQTCKDFLVVGYFKRTGQVNNLNFSKSWLPIRFLAPFPKISIFMSAIVSQTQIYHKYIVDNNNHYSISSIIHPGNFQNIWVLISLGYSDPKQTTYFSYKSSSIEHEIGYQTVGQFPYSGLSLCFACQYSLIYDFPFEGQYSHISIIKEPSIQNQNFHYFPYDGLSTFRLRTAYFSNTDIDSFIVSFNPNFSASGGMCSTGFLYFDGVCITEAGCQSLYLSSQDSYEAINNSWVSENSKCVTCIDNCSICTSSSLCSKCDPGYVLLTDYACQKCSSSTHYDPTTFTCVNICPLSFYADLSNNICVSSFDPISHITGPFLNKVYFQSSYGFQIINSATSLITPSTFASCWLDFNAYKPHSFLGGISFPTTYKIQQTITNLPTSPIKIISFIAFVLDSSSETAITVKVNSSTASLLNSTLFSISQPTCDNDTTLVRVYFLNYKIIDSSTQINVQISSSTAGWGIRQLKVQSIKCHLTCVDCFEDGSPQSCIQSTPLNLKIYEQSICSKGKYIKHDISQYNPPSASCDNCKSNCSACEDTTGNCTQCDPGYLIQQGNCIINSLCFGEYGVDRFVKNCYRIKDYLFEEGAKNTGTMSMTDSLASENNRTSIFSICGSYTLGGGFVNTIYFNRMISQYNTYHYSAYLNVSIGSKGVISSGAFMRITLNGVSADEQFIFPYSTANSCNFSPKTVNRQELLNSSSPKFVEIYFYSSSQYFICDMYMYLGRCHFSCRKCTNIIGQICDICIDNAINSTSDIDKCQCHIGYYMSIDLMTERGECLPCNSACKTCTGPSFLDCSGTTCGDGYIKVGSDCTAACSSGYFWNKTSGSCELCNQCCSECYGPSSQNCRYCANSSLTVNNKLCHFNSDSSICSSCAAASSGYCGGNATNHQFCSSLFWVIYDSTTCVDCSKASSSLCGKTSAFNVVCSQNGYYYSASYNLCKNCSIANQNNCGVSEIQSSCQSQMWKYFQFTTCINCTANPAFHDSKCDICEPTCHTCNGPSDISCLTCIHPRYFYSNSCLQVCPNGWKENTISHVCERCTQLFNSGCQKCHPSCKTCSPQQITSNPGTCSSCWSSRILVGNTCYCSDSEDTRLNYLECSKENVAVLDVILSNSLPQMTINFGKELTNLSGYASGENSSQVCAEIFSSASMVLIGSTSTCQISTKFIIVTLGNSSTVMSGSEILFQSGKLKFKNNSSSFITVFLNNKSSQELPLSTIVEFTYKAEESSCNDYLIENSKIINDSSRGFYSVLWTLDNMNSSDSVDQAIKGILDTSSSLGQAKVIIPKGTIPTNISKKIKLVFILKNTFTETKYFEFKIIQKTLIFNQVSSTLKAPFYRQINEQLFFILILFYLRFQELSVSVFYSVYSCNDQGVLIIVQSPVDIIASSSQSPSVSTFSQVGILSTEYFYTIPPYTLISSNSITILVKTYSKKQNSLLYQQTRTQLNNDHTTYNDQLLTFDVTPSKLVAKIQGGNRQIDYRQNVLIKSTIRDYDIQSETDNQLISTSWKCVDPSNDSLICQGNQGQVNLPSGQITATIGGGTFNPYTVVKIQLFGSKDTRNVQDAIVIIFQEFDLPSLSVDVQVIDPFIQTINLNEEIYIKLNYDTTVNTDILSYSGTIVYQNNVVGIIKFDYVVLRFKLWNIYQLFSRLNSAFSIRFSVFNPSFFMPSIQVLSFNINFPPDHCIFSVSPLSGTLVALTTEFIFSMTGCVDTDLPLSYQFFFYNTATEYSSEIVSPNLVKRKQITDQQTSFQATSILPQGTILVMGVVYDSKTAVYNATEAIPVNQLQLSESAYVSLITNFISSSTFSPQQKISQLSIISQDLSQQLTFTSSNINQSKKDLISAMKSSITQLPSSSGFSSVADKAIQSLIASGISYSESEQQGTLDSMILTLNAPISGAFSELKQDLRKQQLYDYFKVTNSLNEKNDLSSFSYLASTQIDLTNKIAQLVNSNSLPNEDSLVFEGTKLKMYTQKITEKNVCNYYLCSIDTRRLLDSSSPQPKVYNVVFNTFLENPYSQDPSYQNFTSELGKYLNTGETITTYPVINPSLNDSSNNIVKRDERISLNFKQKGTKSNLLSCLSKNSTNQWTQQGCKQIYSQETKAFKCLCSSLSPTTMIDDLDQLFENKNLQTAFGSQGLTNLSNWTNFYSYVAFWVLLSKTIIFIILYKKGRSLDSLAVANLRVNATKVYPENQIAEQNCLSHEQTEQKNESQSPKFQEQNKLNRLRSQSSNKLKLNPSNNQSININVQVPPQSDTQEKAQKNQEIQDFDEIFQSRKDENLQNGNQGVQNSLKVVTPSNALLNDEINTNANTNINLKENEKNNSSNVLQDFHLAKFKKLGIFHSILLFHNFFNIFFIYNEKLSRPFRFSVFYIRILHSLAIATIFESMYSKLQMIVISIANSIIIFIMLKILEILSNSRKCGRIASLIFLTGQLGFYYYVILSIVSGQEAADSNKAFGSFLILFASDVCLSAAIIAIILRTLALYIFKKKGQVSCSKKLFDFLQLDLILTILAK